MRRMLPIMVDRLHCEYGRTGFAAAIAVAVKSGEIRGGDIKAEPMTGLEAVRCSPHVDLQTVDASWLHEFGLPIEVAVPRAQHAALQLDGAAVRGHIAEP